MKGYISHKLNAYVIDNLFNKILCIGRTLRKFHIGWNSSFADVWFMNGKCDCGLEVSCAFYLLLNELCFFFLRFLYFLGEVL